MDISALRERDVNKALTVTELNNYIKKLHCNAKRSHRNFCAVIALRAVFFKQIVLHTYNNNYKRLIDKT